MLIKRYKHTVTTNWVPRHPFLLKWCGVYRVKAAVPSIGNVVSSQFTVSGNEVFRKFVNMFPDNSYNEPIPSKLQTLKGTKLNRVFLEMGHSEECIKDANRTLAQLAGPFSFVVSARPADVMFRGVSRHFKTCLAPDGTYSRYLSDDAINPDVGVAFVRDRAGNMLSRVTVRVGYGVEGPVGLWLHSMVYGKPCDFKNAFKTAGIPLGGHPIRRGYMDGD